MQVSVTGRHMEVTEAIRDFAHDRIEHIMADYPRILGVHVILGVEKYRHIAEVVLQGPHHLRVEAKAESADMYQSITGAVDKAAKQIERVYSKWQDHKAREGVAYLEAKSGTGAIAGES